MRKLIVGGIVAAAAFVLVVGFSYNSFGDLGIGGGDLDIAQASAEDRTSDTLGLKAPRDGLPPGPMVQGATNHPFPGVPRSREGLELEGDPFAPESRADQAWLDRNGYPNIEQFMAYGQASDVLLEQAAQTGDIVARVELDSRRLIAGDETAANELFTAAADGSLYALAKLAAFRGGSKSSGDPIQAYALSRVSEMLGNYKAGLGRDLVVQKVLNPVQRTEAEATAIGLYRDLIELRRARNGPNAPAVDPRPVGKNQ